MKEMIRIYIASPYTKGDREENVKRAMAVFDRLVKQGFAPYAPLLSHYQHQYYPLPYETWLKLDMEWLRQCHALIRLTGESHGADIEMALARSLGKYCFLLTETDMISEAEANMIHRAIENGGPHDVEMGTF